MIDETKEENEPGGALRRYVSYRQRGFRYRCYRFVKRAFDIFASGLFLILFAWLYALLATVVRCNDGGKAIYKHARVGKNGREIFVPKFRSMKTNADRLEDVLTPEEYRKFLEEFKLENDPRVTPLGKKLRKLSLDELPNIWSVFTGKLSLIGPRPLVPLELRLKYGVNAPKLVSVKPGLIGWWAVNGRSNTTYSSGERQRLELFYVDNCSVGLDIRILFKAFGSVFRRTGAR